jgi:hypothetical protein
MSGCHLALGADLGFLAVQGQCHDLTSIQASFASFAIDYSHSNVIIELYRFYFKHRDS